MNEAVKVHRERLKKNLWICADAQMEHTCTSNVVDSTPHGSKAYFSSTFSFCKTQF
jgi:hypothetical protein